MLPGVAIGRALAGRRGADATSSGLAIVDPVRSGHAPVLVDALRRRAIDASELVREHIAWALEQ